MIFIKIILLLYLLPCLVLAQTSLKSDDYFPVEGKTVLTVAIEEIGYFPFNYEENGETKGFSIDVLEYFEENSKYDFEFIVLPWPRAIYLVAEGKVDLILTLFKNSKREQIYDFIEPSYGDEVNQLFTLTDNKFEFNGQLEQLKPYSIGTTREYSYGEAFDQAGYLNKLPALTEAVLLKLLLSGRIDMAISNPLIFNRLMAKAQASAKVKIVEPYVSLTPVYMALTKARNDSREIKLTLGQLTQQLKSSPYYQELLDKYQLNFK